ncbi:MAG: formylglycine-generating enzyme family protein [Betaproteobacteria bacterium]|nr:formylglycine-generating enzyme family protein [Betaproteobacteria bacterium]
MAALTVVGFWGLIPAAANAQGAAAKTTTNSIGMEFVLIPSGSFLMGCNPSNEKCNDNEMPQHRVSISQPFYLGKYEVTQAQWVAVMGNNPSRMKGRDNPVETLSWKDAQVFIQKLNQKEGHNRYRLPTEAEWEYAARAGTSSAYSFGDDANALSGYAWYWGNSGKTTHPVGQKQPNPWGLYDVHGNIREWVQDCWSDNYQGAPTDGSAVDGNDCKWRVLRGGSLFSDPSFARSAYRDAGFPSLRNNGYGLRIAARTQ